MMVDGGATDSLLQKGDDAARDENLKNVFIFENVSLTVKYKYKGGPKKDTTEEVPASSHARGATTYVWMVGGLYRARCLWESRVRRNSVHHGSFRSVGL